ncbi:guanine nucleotide exchange factor [Trichoderma cornu-damae]|uniref:Guanine nucleotide exchange factor n=1 Tax=Trichoderma cornu-damae TaxID=654480 RepID=A0A9P8TSZ4_9HYPO|nr:guanine nucleotide exchange factor [Trichoderma cornu-damae]
MRKPPTAGRPIVPLTGRKSLDRTLPRGRRDEESDRWDVAPDGASAGRAGRQFTVANVGNNGKLYLRPSVRRANKRYPQPDFAFPITPPGTAGLEGVYPENLDEPSNPATDHHGNQFTPTPRTSTLPGNHVSDANGLASATNHRRAVSDGTIRDVNSPTGAADTDGYRIVITKPTHGDDHRPKTTDRLGDLDVGGVPMLNINIPSWKLGTPRFSTRGTPILRGSSYAPTDEFRSASRSSMYHSSGASLGVPPRGLRSRRPSRLVIPQLRFPRTSHASSQASTRPPRAVPSTYASTHLVIGPAMFDDLTFKPACDDRSIVRYSPSGSVTAATPSRLVAEITSPSFLDYELISDFFLTFRAFLEPEILVRMLMARLRWALERTDEVGMIVRVRTFVAMRHWILNYFVDDFLLDYNLRVLFCILLNDFVDELSQDMKERRVQLKILTELKKCWRRICAHYWDGPDFDDALGPQVPVAPGGIAGYRDASLDPTFWEREGVDPPQWHAMSINPDGLSDEANQSNEAARAASIGDFIVSEDRPGTPEHQIITTTTLGNGPTSPLSIASMDIVSCSFPGKNVRSLNPNSSQPLAAHPVYSTSPILPPGAIATTPKALAGKRVRPVQGHGRSNSTTDSSRELGSDQSSSQDVDLQMILQSAGNLVRGNILPPGQPFVDIEADTPTGDRSRQTTIFQPISRNATKDRIFGGAMSGAGMRKFLGGVRRALNSRGQWSSGSHSSLPAVASVGAHAMAMGRLPGPAVVTQEACSGQSSTRPHVRIDLLGAEVAEDFKRAIREEEEAAEAERLGAPRPAPTPAPTIPGPIEYSAAHMEPSTFDHLPPGDQRSRPTSDMGLTAGSQPLVVADHTVPFGKPGMCDRLAATTFNPSVGGLSVGSFLTVGGDPTPPTTPPAQLMAGTPPRSSHLLGQPVAPASASQESLPPFVPDTATSGRAYSLGSSDDASRSSFSTMRRGCQRHPPPQPLSRGTLQMYGRNQSRNAQQSVYSCRRHASFSSRLERHSTARSFDASTDSSVLDREYRDPAVEPPRVLRRRPGGYLRPSANVGGLGSQPVVRRSQSAGSLTTYTESIRSSYLLGTHSEQGGDDCSLAGVESHPRERQEIFSVGQLTEKLPKRHLSLFSTHSSKPIMRPSFEIEARKLAQIPDEDDGGIESALLKLEGKYRPKPKSFEKLRQTALIDAEEFGGAAAAAVDPYIGESGRREGGQTYGVDLEYRPAQSRDVSQGKGKQPLASGYSRDTLTPRNRIATLEACSFLTGDSDESYCSIPLLDRGLTDDGRSGRGTAAWTDRSVFRSSSGGGDVATSDAAMGGSDAPNRASSPREDLSYGFVEKTDSIERIMPGETAPTPVDYQTFLEAASVGGSDLSSELSPSEDEDVDDLGKRARAFSVSSQPHPFGDPIATPVSDSSSAPMSLARALAMSPVMVCPMLVNPERTLDPDQIWSRKPLPLSPEIPQGGPYTTEPNSPHELSRRTEPLRSVPHQSEVPNTLKYSVHLPFILAFDSDTLAQQFTLIEKDALNDIDWRELIEMNWRNATSNDSRSWVDFLRNTNAHGVEVVVARFNIMVKWAISEIVLTQHIEERARCVIKLIHIAAHCRRYRNFATLAQLTIALSSAEVSRLSKTWDLVPPHDLNTLGELEALVTPTRNFYSLRAEMEGGSDGGCIPFVGIYTHDLLFNAQRASEIASSPTTPPLINFERCRIGAAVVKTLLRLLEASTRYTFQPVEGITERCLWMGALSDDEIRRHSEALE